VTAKWQGEPKVNIWAPACEAAEVLPTSQAKGVSLEAGWLAGWLAGWVVVACFDAIAGRGLDWAGSGYRIAEAAADRGAWGMEPC
jgi:hypothetical protein